MSKKLSHYEIELNHLTLGELRKRVAEINKIQFGGKTILKLNKDCRFEYDYSGCYYESDGPNIKIVIPYYKPVAKKKDK